ncbi:MAG: hypothetical protein PUD93_12060 [Lachnospiraceae bacterium]|nr:hypothetical protein [Lachnospiraceae bacterium]
MNEENYWERFLMTGSIKDFLAYKNAVQEIEDDRADGSVREDESGGHSHAGLYRDYGNGFKS